MTTTAGMLQDQNPEKQTERQMGCMAGFLLLFDRHHLLTRKRLCSAKRLPPPPSAADSASESAKSSNSSPPSKKSDTTSQTPDRFYQSSPSPVPEILSKTQPDITPHPLSVFEIKKGTWSSCMFRETPRLSLDSRATTDANGSLHRKQIRPTNQPESSGGGDNIKKLRKSTGVIARLMGLEPLPPSSQSESTAPSPQLQRSAFESRVTRDPFQSRLADNYQLKSIPTPRSAAGVPMRENAMSHSNQEFSTKPPKCQTMRSAPRRTGQQQQQRNYYDSADFFQEPGPAAVSVYGELEKRLTMSRIDGSSKDLETLKHILEALQLQGLLHSNESMDQRNFVSQRNNELRIFVMKPSPSTFSGTESPPPSYSRSRSGLSPCRSANPAAESPPSQSPGPERFDYDRNLSTNGRMRNSIVPTPRKSSMKSINSSIPGRKQCNVEQRSASPKPSFRKSVPNEASSKRNRRPAIDTHPSVKTLFLISDESSKSSVSNSTQSVSQMQRVSRPDEYKEGKSLLSRCDKLLQSIAQMNSTNAPQQASPISVLDPFFYKEDESSSPSPVLKRSIDFKDLPVDFDDEELSWTSSAISTVDASSSDDSDFSYVANVLRALACLPHEPDVFPLLEKQQCRRGKDVSKNSALNRKLIFDNVSEIFNKNRSLPPWKAISSPDTVVPSLPYIWSEFKKIRERDDSEQELFQVICRVLKKDLAADSVSGWCECQLQVADSVLDIERMIFRDLIGDTIRDLASTAMLFYPRRKLTF